MNDNTDFLAYAQMAEIAQSVFPHVALAKEGETLTIQDMERMARKFQCTMYDNDFEDEEITITANTFTCKFWKSMIFTFLARFAALAKVRGSQRITFTKTTEESGDTSHTDSHTEPKASGSGDTSHTEPSDAPDLTRIEQQTESDFDIRSEEITAIIEQHYERWTTIAEKIFVLMMERQNITEVYQRSQLSYDLRKQFRQVVIPLCPYFGTKKGTDALCHGLYKLSIPTERKAA